MTSCKVAIRLSNIGGAWNALGDSKKAITFYEQALSIDKEVYGERHPKVAIRLSNIGGAWDALGDSKRRLRFTSKLFPLIKKCMERGILKLQQGSAISAWHGMLWEILRKQKNISSRLIICLEDSTEMSIRIQEPPKGGLILSNKFFKTDQYFQKLDTNMQG